MKKKEENFVKNNEEILYSLCVDGSNHFEFAYDLISNYFFKLNERMLLTYIFNDKLDYLYNYSNKKETILQAYTDRLAPY